MPIKVLLPSIFNMLQWINRDKGLILFTALSKTKSKACANTRVVEKVEYNRATDFLKCLVKRKCQGFSIPIGLCNMRIFSFTGDLEGGIIIDERVFTGMGACSL